MLKQTTLNSLQIEVDNLTARFAELIDTLKLMNDHQLQASQEIVAVIRPLENAVTDIKERLTRLENSDGQETDAEDDGEEERQWYDELNRGYEKDRI